MLSNKVEQTTKTHYQDKQHGWSSESLGWAKQDRQRSRTVWPIYMKSKNMQNVLW